MGASHRRVTQQKQSTTPRKLDALSRYTSDGRLAIDNNPAERALRIIAVSRKNFLFLGSDRGGERAAAIYTLIETAKLNNVDPQAWLADVLARIADHDNRDLRALLHQNWAISGRASQMLRG